jgi:cytochrome c oxidase subunit II
MDITIILKKFWLPEVASEHGELVDHMNAFVHWFMLALFVGWSLFLAYVFYNNNAKRTPKANYKGVTGHATTHVEIGVCIVEAILLIGFAFPLWKKQAAEYPVGPDVVKVRALGEQFLWTYQYAGNDGVLGAVNPKLITANNPTGRDMNDPNGKDDFIKSGTLTLPETRPAIIDVGSKDVIHNLAIPIMRIAQDATPGIKSHMWFKPIKTGTWDIICGQLCGSGHSQMKGTLEVVTAKDYEAWVKENSDAALKTLAVPALAVR